MITARRGWRKLVPWLFVAPNMIVFLTFTIWPALNGFNISFYDSDNGRYFTPVGTDNYRQIFTDPEFWTVVRQTAIFVVGFVGLTLIVATALALLLNAQQRGRGALRAAYFLPVLLSPVVVGLIWGWALDRQIGLVNTVLGGLRLGQPGWLIEPNLAMVCTIAVGVWIHLGFYAMILLSGLQSMTPTSTRRPGWTAPASRRPSGRSPCPCCGRACSWSRSSRRSPGSSPSTSSTP